MSFPASGDEQQADKEALIASEIPEHDDGEEHFVGFADEDEGEEEPTPLVKRLREQNRELSRKLHQRVAPPANDSDPEPAILGEPGSVEDFEYDAERHREAWRKHTESIKSHTEWERRRDDRKRDGERAQTEIQKRVEQQKAGLRVNDFDDKAALVKDRLSDPQMAILLEGADNPAALLYALGRSETKLDMLAAETSLTKFAFLASRLERDIKMGKKAPPPPMDRVRGGNAGFTAPSSDKELERLEKEADKSGDRTKVINYRREIRQRNVA